MLPIVEERKKSLLSLMSGIRRRSSSKSSIEREEGKKSLLSLLSGIRRGIEREEGLVQTILETLYQGVNRGVVMIIRREKSVKSIDQTTPSVITLT